MVANFSHLSCAQKQQQRFKNNICDFLIYNISDFISLKEKYRELCSWVLSDPGEGEVINRLISQLTDQLSDHL